MVNDINAFLKKVARRLGLLPILDALPEDVKINTWADVVYEDTMVTFSRYYPNKFPLVINSDTCDKKKERGITWYYIKDEILEGVNLLGIEDIDWTDLSSANNALGATSIGGGYYYPSFACPEATMESILSLQLNANISSLYNRGIFIDYDYGTQGKFALKGLGNTNYDLNTFVIKLLVAHTSLATISPTKMETFESLAQADIANYLFEYLKYYDGLETIFVNIDLHMNRLENEAGKREEVLNFIKESYVSTSNDNIPYIMTV